MKFAEWIFLNLQKNLFLLIFGACFCANFVFERLQSNFISKPLFDEIWDIDENDETAEYVEFETEENQDLFMKQVQSDLANVSATKTKFNM